MLPNMALGDRRRLRDPLHVLLQSDAHAGAAVCIHTGTILLNRPSLGSWISYGLGTENQNLPAFVALDSGAGGAVDSADP